MSEAAPSPAAPGGATVRHGRLRRIINRLWWLHSFGALAFGIGVMIFARRGLDYAETVLVVLFLSWLLVFVAFRVIVGARNRKPGEHVAKKGLRLFTNYVIKQLYQQMFFFLVPLYAVSATWSLSSPNWWLPPLLLLCAVLSTMDLVFDNFIMERRVVASSMYGLCMFGVLNLVLPLVFGLEHFVALMIAAAATAPTVALLSFRLRSLLSVSGIALVLLLTIGLTGAAYVGRAAIPPAPMSLVAAGIGHGAPGAYECIPGPKRTMHTSRLDELRCVSEVGEPGGLRSEIVHVWLHDGNVLARVVELERLERCDGDVFISRLVRAALPADPVGRLSCVIRTEEGQLVGRRDVEIVADEPDAPAPSSTDAAPTPIDAGAKKRARDAAPSKVEPDADAAGEGAGQGTAEGKPVLDADGDVVE